jgi:GcrA cell cycle regulator
MTDDQLSATLYAKPREWTDEETRALADMAAAGYSSGWVANELGMTRNAVIGKARREGIQFRSNLSGDQRIRPIPYSITPRPQKKRKADPLPTFVTTKIAQAAFRKGHFGSAANYKRKMAAVANRAAYIKRLFAGTGTGPMLWELKGNQCKWPEPPNDLGITTFCADPVEPGRPYCPCHWQLSVEPRKPRAA